MANGKFSAGRAILVMFIGAIVATVFLGSIATTIVGDTSTITRANTTLVIPVVNTTTSLDGREIVGSMIVINLTGADVSTTFDTTDKLVNGLLTVAITSNDTSVDRTSPGTNINVSYTANPDGFVGATARGVTLLILIFAALAILIFVIVILFDRNSALFEMVKNFGGK